MRISSWILIPALALLVACGSDQPAGSGPPPPPPPPPAPPPPPPPPPEPAAKTVFLSAGSSHTCMADTTGVAWCWGWNESGQVDVEGPNRLAPTKVPGLPEPITQVGAGVLESCALGASGKVYCWGDSRPAQVPAGVSFVSLWSGGLGYCWLTAAGKAYCWDTTQAYTSVSPDMIGQPADLPFTALGVGGGGLCGLTPQGKVYCWGYGSWGERGDGTNTFTAELTPVLAPPGVTFRAIATKSQSSCALSTTGQAYCWGLNNEAQLGDGTLTDRNVPTPVQQPTGVSFTTIARGFYHSCATTEEGAVYCWGGGPAGVVPRPVQLPAGVKIASVTIGFLHICAAARSAGQVYCWGNNSQGQLGDGTTTDRHTPVLVAMP